VTAADAQTAQTGALNTSGSEIAGQGVGMVPTADPASLGTDRPEAKAASEQDETAESKEADDPDGHGVVDALVVMKYGEQEVLDCAAIHNLIAAGYFTADEAVGVYKKRYPKADQGQTETFKKKFQEEYSRKKIKSTLVSSKLPKNMRY
jgi:hypothetical protein